MNDSGGIVAQRAVGPVEDQIGQLHQIGTVGDKQMPRPGIDETRFARNAGEAGSRWQEDIGEVVGAGFQEQGPAASAALFKAFWRATLWSSIAPGRTPSDAALIDPRSSGVSRPAARGKQAKEMPATDRFSARHRPNASIRVPARSVPGWDAGIWPIQWAIRRGHRVLM